MNRRNMLALFAAPFISLRTKTPSWITEVTAWVEEHYIRNAKKGLQDAFVLNAPLGYKEAKRKALEAHSIEMEIIETEIWNGNITRKEKEE